MAFVSGLVRVWCGHGKQLGNGGIFSGFRSRDSVDPQLELLQSAIPPANGVVWPAGNDVLSFAASVGRDFGKITGDFLGDTESQPGSAIWCAETLFLLLPQPIATF